MVTRKSKSALAPARNGFRANLVSNCMLTTSGAAQRHLRISRSHSQPVSSLCRFLGHFETAARLLREPGASGAQYNPAMALGRLSGISPAPRQNLYSFQAYQSFPCGRDSESRALGRKSVNFPAQGANETQAKCGATPAMPRLTLHTSSSVARLTLRESFAAITTQAILSGNARRCGDPGAPRQRQAERAGAQEKEERRRQAPPPSPSSRRRTKKAVRRLLPRRARPRAPLLRPRAPLPPRAPPKASTRLVMVLLAGSSRPRNRALAPPCAT